MVLDTFVHAEAHGGAEGRRKIAPQHMNGRRRRHSRAICHVTIPVWLAGVLYAVGRAARPQYHKDTLEEAS